MNTNTSNNTTSAGYPNNTVSSTGPGVAGAQDSTVPGIGTGTGGMGSGAGKGNAPGGGIGAKVGGAYHIVHGMGENIRGTTLGAIDTATHKGGTENDEIARRGRMEIEQGMAAFKTHKANVGSGNVAGEPGAGIHGASQTAGGVGAPSGLNQGYGTQNQMDGTPQYPPASGYSEQNPSHRATQFPSDTRDNLGGNDSYSDRAAQYNTASTGNRGDPGQAYSQQGVYGGHASSNTGGSVGGYGTASYHHRDDATGAGNRTDVDPSQEYPTAGTTSTPLNGRPSQRDGYQTTGQNQQGVYGGYANGDTGGGIGGHGTAPYHHRDDAVTDLNAPPREQHGVNQHSTTNNNKYPAYDRNEGFSTHQEGIDK